MFRFSRFLHNGQGVANQGFVHVYLLDSLLHFQHIGGGEYRLQVLQLRRAGFRSQDVAFGIPVWIAHSHPHQEPIEL